MKISDRKTIHRDSLGALEVFIEKADYYPDYKRVCVEMRTNRNISIKCLTVEEARNLSNALNELANKVS